MVFVAISQRHFGQVNGAFAAGPTHGPLEDRFSPWQGVLKVGQC